MITVEFFRNKSEIIGFRISGHAGYSVNGDDIVCASVSSADQFAANLITECFKTEADVNAVGETINLMLTGLENRDNAVKVLDALKLHLELLSEDYEKTIKITFLEV